MKKYITFAVFIPLLALVLWTTPASATLELGECLKLTTTLRMGNRDVIHVDPAARFLPGQVYTLQQFLQAQGYLYSQPTGYFGPLTHRALINFQRANGLTQTGNTNLLTRNKIQSMTCGGVSNTNLPIRIISPAGGEQVNLGNNIQVTIENALYVAPSNATGGYGMYYVVDLVNTYGVVQNLGVMNVNTPSSRQTGSYQISGSLPVGSDYRILITPSCFTSTAEPRCQVVSSNTFSIGRTTTVTGVTITSPNGGETIAAGSTFRLQGTMPSDRRYEVSYYLMPKSGTPILTGNGSYYNPTTGGYSLGGYNLNDPVSSINTEVIIPADIPAGNYKMRVFLTVAGTPRPNSHTPSNTFAYDDSNSSFTITNSTTNNSLRVITPNGGERLEMNKEYRVEWTSSLSSTERVNITLEKEPYICPIGYYCTAEAAPIYTIANNVLNQGYYNWNINASALSQTYGRPFTIGRYKIRITAVNRNNTDTSDNFFNIVQGVVNTTVNIDSPLSNTWWPVNSRQVVNFSTTNLPSGAVAVISLRRWDGAIGVLKTASVSNTNSIEVGLDSMVSGDVVDAIRPGNYSLTVDIYDRTPCLGLCAPNYPAAQKLASDTIIYINIY